MQKGDKVRVRELRENDAGNMYGRRFVVTERYSEDRASGVTVVTFSDGIRERFVWDRDDPIVTYIGTGKVTVTVEFDQ